MRLVSYWVSHTGKLLHRLDQEAKLAGASTVSPGDGLGGDTQSLPAEARMLAMAVTGATLDRRGTRQVRDLLLKGAPGGGGKDAAEQAVSTVHHHRSRSMAAGSAASLLSDREKEVLRWISLGASNKSVAQKLSISASTVRTHVESAFRKLGCTTRTAAALKAMRLGLLDPPDPSRKATPPD